MSKNHHLGGSRPDGHMVKNHHLGAGRPDGHMVKQRHVVQTITMENAWNAWKTPGKRQSTAAGM